MKTYGQRRWTWTIELGLLACVACSGELSGAPPLDGRARDGFSDARVMTDRSAGDDLGVDTAQRSDSARDQGPAPDSTRDQGPTPDSTRDQGPAPDSSVDQGPPVDARVDSGPRPDTGAPACGAITTFADGKQPSREIFVAPGGNDQTGDGSRATPYATLSRAAQDATPGTAIRLLAGTYAGGDTVANLAGNASAPIWIGGEPGGARPVIEGGGQAFQLSRVRYLVVHDIEVRNTTDNGINCDDGGDYGNIDATRYVVFLRLDIHDVGGTGNQDCLKLSGVDDYYVLDSRFARCGGGGSGSGIDHVGCHEGLIAHNTFESMSGNAVQCKGGSADIEVRANWMDAPGERGVNMGGSTGFTFFRPPLSTSGDNAEAWRIRVVANVIIGGVTPFAFVGCVDCLAANNTVIDSERWLMRILQETVSDTTTTFLPASNGEVTNNLFYFARGAISTEVNVGPNTAPDTFSFTTNLWYAHDAPAQSLPTLPVTETGGVVGQDPALDNVYAISSASPAAGHGSAVAGVTADYAGQCYATPPSIGAYEATP